MATATQKINQKTEELTIKLELLIKERNIDAVLDDAENIAAQLRLILASEKVKAENKERAIAAIAALMIALSTKTYVPIAVDSPTAITYVKPAPISAPAIIPTSGTASPEAMVAEANKLFASAKSIGAIAVGHAEGNYDVDGNPQGNYFGHIDPGNAVRNYGFCSDQNRSKGDLKKADLICLDYNKRNFPRLAKIFKQEDINPTVFQFLVGSDLYNQANPRHAKLFPSKLKELKEKYKNADPVEYVASVRAATFWIDGENTATGLLRACNMRRNPPKNEWDCVYGDQLRRVRAIARVLQHHNISLTQPLVAQQAPTIKPVVDNSSPWDGVKKLFRAAHQPIPTLNYIADQQDDKLAQRIVAAMEKRGYPIARGKGETNIVYLRTSRVATNGWDAKRKVITFEKGKPKIIFSAEATSYPGDHYIFNGNPKGGPFLRDDHYPSVWTVGTHYGTTGTNIHEALVQAKPLTVVRSHDRDFSDGKLDTGKFWINIHGSQRLSATVGKASAGCPVTRGMKPHREFMEVVKSDPRYKANNGFLFSATFINSEDL